METLTDVSHMTPSDCIITYPSGIPPTPSAPMKKPAKVGWGDERRHVYMWWRAKTLRETHRGMRERDDLLQFALDEWDTLTDDQRKTFLECAQKDWDEYLMFMEAEAAHKQ